MLTCGGGIAGVGVGAVYPGVPPDSAKSLSSPGEGFGNSYTRRSISGANERVNTTTCVVSYFGAWKWRSWVKSFVPDFSANDNVIDMSNSPHPCSSSLNGGFLNAFLVSQ